MDEIEPMEEIINTSSTEDMIGKMHYKEYEDEIDTSDEEVVFITYLLIYYYVFN